MTIRRLLGASGGAGSFVIPAPTVTDLGVDGAWTPIRAPGAVWANGYTFFGYINSTGYIKVQSVADESPTPEAAVTLHGPGTADWHCAPALVIRNSDERLVAAYMPIPSGGDINIRISTNPVTSDPTLSGGFGAEDEISGDVGGSGDYTYPTLVQLSGESNKLFLFYRDDVAPNVLTFTTSTDGGATWAAHTNLYANGSARAYWTIGTNGTDRIDFQIADGYVGYDSPVSLYHMYYAGGAYYRTDGTAISGSPPFDDTDLTLVYDGTTTPVLVPFGVVTDGTTPAMVFETDPTIGNNQYRYAHWSGSAWSDHLITETGQTSTGTFRESGVALVTAGLAFAGRLVSGKWEMGRYVTSDGGATWTETMLTTSSTDHHVNPVFVQACGPSLRGLWTHGTGATIGTGYDLTVIGSS
jgi:hypothetical protein